MKRFNRRKGGFTLIELMIVVAIIGILAAIAIPNFLKFQLKAKTSEGKTNLAAIRTAEESYYSEFGAYVSAQASPAGTLIGSTKAVYSATDASTAGFDLLGWSPEGLVYFNYAAVAAGTNNFIATASADIDGNGTSQTWGYKKGVTQTAATHDTPGETICTWAALDRETVGRCVPTYGQSVF